MGNQGRNGWPFSKPNCDWYQFVFRVLHRITVKLSTLCWSPKWTTGGMNCTSLLRSCVSSGGAPTLAGTLMFTMWKITTHMKCEVRHNWDMGMGHLWLNGWSIYTVMTSCCFVWKYAQKLLDFRGVPFPIITWPQVSVPLNSRPEAYYRGSRTTLHLRLLFEESSSR